MKFFLTLLFTVTFAFSSTAFVETTQLRKLIIKQNTVLLDTTDVKTFQKGHIPSAIHVSLASFRHQSGAYQQMNSPQKIQKLMRSLGINNNSTVILYGHNKPKELLKASYMALAFIANGLQNVSILNGGYEHWLFEYEDFISTANKNIKPGTFTGKYNANILVDLKYVREHIGKIPMIEARPIRYFKGEAQSSGVKRLGHIAKAQSSAWSNKFEHDQTIKSDSQLNEIYINMNHLNPNKEVITYCTGGLEASMNWYILHQHLHFKDVKLYDASMREWGNRDDTPMEK